MAETSRTLLDHLEEINHVHKRCAEAGLTLPHEPLFSSYAEVKQHLPQARLSEELTNQKAYYQEVQSREPSTRLLRALLRAEKDQTDPDVDILRRTDSLFRILFDDFESLMLFQDVIFRIKMPKGGKRLRVAVVVHALDADRLCFKYHGHAHRGCLYLYTLMSIKIYL